MANWTVSQSSVSTTQGATVSTDVVLTITPNTGYVISASDFKIGEATDSGSNVWTGGNVDIGVNTVTFADVTTAGAVGNTVTATVAFDSFTMGSSDKELFIDIDEKVTITDIDRSFCIKSKHTAETDGNVNKHTVTYASAPTNITTTCDAACTLIHNIGDGIVEHLTSGTVVNNPAYPGAQVIQVTFATNTTYGYYYTNTPSFTLTGSNSSYYEVIDSSLTYTSMTTGGVTSNELTSVVYTVYYTPPNSTIDPDIENMCELGQVVLFNHNIRQEDQGEPGAVPQITSVVVDTSNILSTGETRVVRIYGDNTAQFYLKVVSSDSSKTYDFGPTGSGANGTFTAGATTSGINTMGTNGSTHYPIDFPATSSNLTYDIIIIPIVPTTTAVGVPIAATDLRLYQYTQVVVTLGIIGDNPSGDNKWDEGEFPTAITITGEAGRSLKNDIRKAFSYTITPAMLTSDSAVAPKSSLSFALDNQGTVDTLTDGAASSATHDVDSTTGIVVGNTINWSVDKTPLFSEEAISEILVGEAGQDATLEIPPNIDNLTVGMILSAPNIRARSGDNVTITAIGTSSITISEEITTDSKIDITFTAAGVTVDTVTDGDTIVASQSLNLTDNLSLTFGGETADVGAYIVNGTSTQSSANVILAGTLVVSSFPTANATVKIDINELITKS